MRAADFPEIVIQGDDVDAKSCIAKGTSNALGVAYILGFFALIFGILVTYFTLLIAILLSPLITWYLNRKAMAMIHGSGVHVTQDQFPEIYDCVQEFSMRLGLKEAPAVYIVEEEVLNAAAVRIGKKNVILLTDDMIHGCIKAGNPRALAFIIGHELGHIALGHNNIVRGYISKVYKKLSRLDEYTCDQVGSALVQNNSIACFGLMILTVGPQLSKFVDFKVLLRQAVDVHKNKYSAKAENSLTHPLLLNRLYRIAQNKR